MEGTVNTLKTVLDITIRFGLPVIMLFLVGCLLQRTELLVRAVSRLLGEHEDNGAEAFAASEDWRAEEKERG